MDAVKEGDGLSFAAVGAWFEGLSRGPYRRAEALELMALARDSGTGRRDRNLVILALEHLILGLAADDLEEFDALFVALGLKSHLGTDAPLSLTLLKEGYTTIEPARFVVEFKRRLRRLARVHDRCRRRPIDAAMAAELIHLAEQECKLTLGRYLIPPAAVVAGVRARLRRSRGLADPLNGISGRVAEEAAHAVARLPPFEAAIARSLCRTGEIYWYASAAAGSLNAVVESPPATVVTVVKPPGSDVEFELKRTGARDGPLLDARCTRDGRPLPSAHRLHGGAMGSLLVHEASASAVLADVFRTVHSREAPISRVLAIKSVYAVPGAHDAAPLLDYFTNPGDFGGGFQRMREGMAEAVAAFDREGGEPPLAAPGAVGLTARFLAHVAPKQSLLVNTSSWRLDQLARYLSPDGPRFRFGDELGVAYGPDEARRFAEDLLDEVLGVYRPPPVRYEDYHEYVEAAFAWPANRARADGCYRALMAQTGELWGTLLAGRGYSTGESFVARNVGLRSVWRDGRWRVTALFMDHDNLHLGHPAPNFRPLRLLHGTVCDATYLFGHGAAVTGSVEYLEQIYRVPPALRSRGRRRLFDAARAAYRATQAAIRAEPRLQRYFHPDFVARLHHWDLILRDYFDRGQELPGTIEWKRDTRLLLRDRGYDAALVDEHVAAAVHFARGAPQLAEIL